MQKNNNVGSPACPADLKYGNRIQVIETFLSGGVCSTNDISATIGLSRQTVMKSIQFFLRSGLLISVGKGDSTHVGGKRPELFALSPEKYFLCITLWPQELRLHLFTIGQQLKGQICLSRPLPPDPKAAMDHVGRLSVELLEQYQIPPENLCAVSVSTAGTVDYKTGRLKYSSQSPAWGTDVPLVSYLQPYFAPNTMIFLENAGKMTARPFLLEKDLAGKRVLVIFACWGLSSCLIEKGRILGGKNSLIGEIGHMIIDPSDPETCGCGSHGCLERLVSVDRVRSILQQQAAHFPGSSLLQSDPEQITIPRYLPPPARRTLWPVTWSITWPGPLLRLSETFPWFLTRISLCFKAITPGPTRTLTSGFGESSGNSSTFLRKDPLKFTMTSVPWRKWMFWAPTPH